MFGPFEYQTCPIFRWLLYLRDVITLQVFCAAVIMELFSRQTFETLPSTEEEDNSEEEEEQVRKSLRILVSLRQFMSPPCSSHIEFLYI